MVSSSYFQESPISGILFERQQILRNLITLDREARLAVRVLHVLVSKPKHTTAHILYRIPDFETVPQTYVWQDYDLAPNFPEMRKFPDFWQSSFDGPLHFVGYSHQRLIRPNEWPRVDGKFKLQ